MTDQLLRRLPYTARLADAACGAHERLDGSGYHRRAELLDLDDAQRVIAAADCYQAMTSDRPYRPARTATGTRHRATSDERRRQARWGAPSKGSWLPPVTAAPPGRRYQAGLSAHEVEVLRLLALGLTTADKSPSGLHL